MFAYFKSSSAFEQDAESAVCKYNNYELKGRKLQIEIAVNRGQNPSNDTPKKDPASDKKTVTEPTAEIKKSVPAKAAVSADIVAVSKIKDESAKQKKLQIVVIGVPQEIGKKVFRKYLKSVLRKATVNVITKVK